MAAGAAGVVNARRSVMSWLGAGILGEPGLGSQAHPGHRRKPRRLGSSFPRVSARVVEGRAACSPADAAAPLERSAQRDLVGEFELSAVWDPASDAAGADLMVF